MKKTLVIMGLLLLSACVNHDTDLDAQAAQRQERLEMRHQATGCTFARNHDAYRNCILNTYYMQQPRTYTTAELDSGKPLAISGTGCRAAQPPVLAGIAEPPPQPGWAAPMTESHTSSVETVCSKTYQPQEAVITTTEMPVNPPAPEVIVVEQEQEAPEPAPERHTWWDSYRANKKPAPEPKCPCEDPNDPCPQCYNK